MEFSIGDTKITYEADWGSNIDFVSDIDDIIGDKELIIITDIVSTKYGYNAYEVDNLGATIEAFRTLHNDKIIFIVMPGSGEGLHRRALETIFSGLGFVDIANMYNCDMLELITMVLAEGLGRKVAAIAVADKYMSNSNFSMMPICIWHVSCMQQYMNMEGKFDELVAELYEAMEKTTRDFNAKYIPSKKEEDNNDN